jgi:hypothetical protein
MSARRTPVPARLQREYRETRTMKQLVPPNKRHLEHEADLHDMADPQIPAEECVPFDERRQLEISDHRDREEVVEARVLDLELLDRLAATLRNALSDVERLVLQRRIQDPAIGIGGARVLRAFIIGDNTFELDQRLAADEVEGIAPADRKALVEGGFLKIFPASRQRPWARAKFKDGATYEEIAEEAGLHDRAHARKVGEGAVKKIAKHFKD